MKKILSVLILLSLILSLFGCKIKEQDETASNIIEDETSAPADESVNKSPQEQSINQPDKTETPQQSESDKSAGRENVAEQTDKADDQPQKSEETSTTPPTESEQPKQEEAPVVNKEPTVREEEEEAAAEEEKETVPATPNKEKPTEKQIKSDFISHGSLASDVFKGKIVSEEILAEIPDYMTIVIDRDDSKENLQSINYTVKIEKVYRQTYLKEGTYITVNHLVALDRLTPQENKPWNKKYEVGEEYIFSVSPDVYNDKPMMVESKNVTAHISKDGALTPMTAVSTWLTDAFYTLEEFENNAIAQNYFREEHTYVKQDGKFYADMREKDYDRITNPNAVKSNEEIIAYISNAIIIDDPTK